MRSARWNQHSMVVGLLLAASCGPRPAADPCANTSCGAGTCTALGSLPQCTCNPGASLQNGTCVADLCLPNPCSGGHECSVVDGAAHCACPAGHVEANERCVAAACAPNPCTTVPHQTVCSVSNGAVTCGCEPGYAPTDLGCGDTPVFDCAQQHTGSGADWNEPNECPSLATPLPLSATPAPRTHTLFPAGDVDWLKVTAGPQHAVALTVSDATLVLVLDVYQADGLTRLGSMTVGGLTASTHVVVPATDSALFVRISAFGSTPTGQYRIAARDDGLDDYPNTTVGAPRLSLAMGFSGQLQYSGDVDVAAVSTVRGHAYRLDLQPSTTAGIRVQVLSADGGVVVATLDSSASSTSVTATGRSLLVRAVGLDENTLGPFAVQVTNLTNDDFGDSRDDAEAIAVGTRLDGGMQFVSDHDFFTFEALAGHSYRVQCDTTDSQLCAMEVTSAASSVLGTVSGGTGSSRLVFSVSAVTRVYVDVSALSGTGRYSVLVTDLSVDDFGNTPATANPISIGTSVSGALQYDTDVDVFSFSAIAGHFYQVTCTASSAAVCALDVRVPGGQASVGAMSGGLSTAVRFGATISGLYTAAIGSGNSGPTGSYSVLVADLGTDDFGNTPATASPITEGTPVSGVIDYGLDRDTMSFPGTAGHLYRVACTSASPFLCGLAVMASAGTPQLGSANPSASTSVVFAAPTTGSYVVEVSSELSTLGDRTGSYTVTVTDLGADDHGDTPATGTPITPSASSTAGNLQTTSDLDVFTFSGTAGTVYRFSCTTSMQYGCGMKAKNAAQTVVASSNAFNPSIGFKAATSGSYSIEVKAAQTGATGAYSVQLSETSDDFGDTAATAGTLVLGAPQAAIFEYEFDVDYFSVTMVGGVTYTATATPASTTFTVFDPAMAPVSLTSGGAFTAATSGTYFVRAQASSNAGGYSLLVQ